MKIELSGDKQFFERFEKNFKREVQTAFRDSVSTIQASVRGKIRSKGIVDTGNLINKIEQKVSFSQNAALGIVGTNVLYALPLEFGIQKRFFPSVQMIEGLIAWVKRKGIASGKEANKAGAAIAWKIARTGLDKRRFPGNFFKDGFTQSVPLVAKIFERNVKRAIELSKGAPK